MPQIDRPASDPRWRVSADDLAKWLDFPAVLATCQACAGSPGFLGVWTPRAHAPSVQIGGAGYPDWVGPVTTSVTPEQHNLRHPGTAQPPSPRNSDFRRRERSKEEERRRSTVRRSTVNRTRRVLELLATGVVVDAAAKMTRRR